MVPRAFRRDGLDTLVPAVGLVVCDEKLRVDAKRLENDVQGRYAALFVSFEPLDRAPRAVARRALVVGELASLQEVVAAQICARNSVVEELRLVYEAVLGGDGKRQLRLKVLVLAGNPSGNVPQLTLFPRVSFQLMMEVLNWCLIVSSYLTCFHTLFRHKSTEAIMDASPRRIVGLMTGAGTRFVVPVFQRPYSWDLDNCNQLWEDILAVGRGNGSPHFTGSVVWIQQGLMSPGGITPLMLIDGQQRMTTITLLIIALARYAKAHPEKQLSFSLPEIIDRSYLVDKYKSGDDRYKLTLSQGDRMTLRTLEDNLENDDVEIVQDSERLLENLAFFEGLVNGIDDVNVVWAGIQRLEVVNISLAQGQDNPQLIFESMNSTGKDLSSADLIRNFVLMGHPNQDELYQTYWRPIETTLGASTYDSVFDEFIRDWLTVLYAPEPLVRRDVYQTFKRHFEKQGYGKTVPVENLLKELCRYASYYSDITGGKSDDPEIARLLGRIRRLDISVVDPLLMSMLDDLHHHAFDRDGLISMLGTIESYLFRRTVCDCPTNSLQKFFSSLIGRLNRVQEDEGTSYVEAFEAFLLNEAGTARRFPNDGEFRDKLRTRDAYHFRRSLYLLSRLENSYHPKNERDFADGTYTIEHIMPQNARAHQEWLYMLGDVDEEGFEHLLHNIGNLTITAYNSELSDGTFQQKKERAVGGYEVEWINISSDLKNAEEWTPEAIEKRAKRLVKRAVQTWPIPVMDEEKRKSFLPEKKNADQSKEITFKDLFNAGLIKEGDILESCHPSWQGKATVTAVGTILLPNGQEFSSPSPACVRLFALQGSSLTATNGWWYLRLENGGPKLADLRTQLQNVRVENERERFRVAFWDSFYEYCSDDQAFVDAFGDQTGRLQNTDWWASFGIGFGFCHLEARISRRDKYADVAIYYPAGEKYDALFAMKEEIEIELADADAVISWTELDASTKFRWLCLRRTFDYDEQDWSEAQEWMRGMLLRLRAIALETYA